MPSELWSVWRKDGHAFLWLEVAEALSRKEADAYAQRIASAAKRLGFSDTEVVVLPAKRVPNQREGTQ
jgi:hypothetical protein